MSLANSVVKQALQLLLRSLGLLPLPVLHLLAIMATPLLLMVPNQLRNVAWKNLKFCYPEASSARKVQILVSSSFHSLAALLEAPAIWNGPEWRLKFWLRNKDVRQQLQTLYTQNQGVILLCPHWGAWELSGMFCAQVGPVTSLYKPQKGDFNQLIITGRSRLGAKLVPTDSSGVRMILSALRRKEMVGVLPDHDPPDETGVFAPLFGHPAHTMDLVTKLAARTGAPIAFLLAERRWFCGFRFHLIPASAEIADATHGVAVLNQEVEAVIRRWPKQYWWGYKRFRRRPAGSINPYR